MEVCYITAKSLALNCALLSPGPFGSLQGARVILEVWPCQFQACWQSQRRVLQDAKGATDPQDGVCLSGGWTENGGCWLEDFLHLAFTWGPTGTSLPISALHSRFCHGKFWDLIFCCEPSYPFSQVSKLGFVVGELNLLQLECSFSSLWGGALQLCGHPGSGKDLLSDIKE